MKITSRLCFLQVCVTCRCYNPTASGNPTDSGQYFYCHKIPWSFDGPRWQKSIILLKPLRWLLFQSSLYILSYKNSHIPSSSPYIPRVRKGPYLEQPKPKTSISLCRSSQMPSMRLDFMVKRTGPGKARVVFGAPWQQTSSFKAVTGRGVFAGLGFLI